MFHSFSIKTLPNWVFAVFIGAFWLEYARQETVFVRFEAWLGLLVLSNLYLAVEKNTQGEWEWTAAHSYRCGFALVSALVILLSVGTGNLDGGATFGDWWPMLARIGLGMLVCKNTLTSKRIGLIAMGMRCSKQILSHCA